MKIVLMPLYFLFIINFVELNNQFTIPKFHSSSELNNYVRQSLKQDIETLNLLDRAINTPKRKTKKVSRKLKRENELFIEKQNQNLKKMQINRKNIETHSLKNSIRKVSNLKNEKSIKERSLEGESSLDLMGLFDDPEKDDSLFNDVSSMLMREDSGGILIRYC